MIRISTEARKSETVDLSEQDWKTSPSQDFVVSLLREWLPGCLAVWFDVIKQNVLESSIKLSADMDGSTWKISSRGRSAD